MAWEARSGLKLTFTDPCDSMGEGLNGLGSPFGIETPNELIKTTWFWRLNGLGSPFGIETIDIFRHLHDGDPG